MALNGRSFGLPEDEINPPFDLEDDGNEFLPIQDGFGAQMIETKRPITDELLLGFFDEENFLSLSLFDCRHSNSSLSARLEKTDNRTVSECQVDWSRTRIIQNPKLLRPVIDGSSNELLISDLLNQRLPQAKESIQDELIGPSYPSSLISSDSDSHFTHNNLTSQSIDLALVRSAYITFGSVISLSGIVMNLLIILILIFNTKQQRSNTNNRNNGTCQNHSLLAQMTITGFILSCYTFVSLICTRNIDNLPQVSTDRRPQDIRWPFQLLPVPPSAALDTHSAMSNRSQLSQILILVFNNDDRDRRGNLQGARINQIYYHYSSYPPKFGNNITQLLKPKESMRDSERFIELTQSIDSIFIETPIKIDHQRQMRVKNQNVSILISFLVNLLLSIHAWTALGIVYDRYCAIAHPFQYLRSLYASRIRRFLMLSWTFLPALSLLIPLSYFSLSNIGQTDHSIECHDQNWRIAAISKLLIDFTSFSSEKLRQVIESSHISDGQIASIYSLVTLLVTTLAPLTIITICNFKVYRIVKVHERRLSVNSSAAVSLFNPNGSTYQTVALSQSLERNPMSKRKLSSPLLNINFVQGTKHQLEDDSKRKERLSCPQKLCGGLTVNRKCSFASDGAQMAKGYSSTEYQFIEQANNDIARSRRNSFDYSHNPSIMNQIKLAGLSFAGIAIQAHHVSRRQSSASTLVRSTSSSMDNLRQLSHQVASRRTESRCSVESSPGAISSANINLSPSKHLYRPRRSSSAIYGYNTTYHPHLLHLLRSRRISVSLNRDPEVNYNLQSKISNGVSALSLGTKSIAFNIVLWLIVAILTVASSLIVIQFLYQFGISPIEKDELSMVRSFIKTDEIPDFVARMVRFIRKAMDSKRRPPAWLPIKDDTADLYLSTSFTLLSYAYHLLYLSLISLSAWLYGIRSRSLKSTIRMILKRYISRRQASIEISLRHKSFSSSLRSQDSSLMNLPLLGQCEPNRPALGRANCIHSQDPTRKNLGSPTSSSASSSSPSSLQRQQYDSRRLSMSGLINRALSRSRDDLKQPKSFTLNRKPTQSKSLQATSHDESISRSNECRELNEASQSILEPNDKKFSHARYFKFLITTDDHRSHILDLTDSVKSEIPEIQSINPTLNLMESSSKIQTIGPKDIIKSLIDKCKGIFVKVELEPDRAVEQVSETTTVDIECPGNSETHKNIKQMILSEYKSYQNLEKDVNLDFQGRNLETYRGNHLKPPCFLQFILNPEACRGPDYVGVPSLSPIRECSSNQSCSSSLSSLFMSSPHSSQFGGHSQVGPTDRVCESPNLSVVPNSIKNAKITC